jgi:Carboxypeptidase regulatory-like domain
VDRIVILIAFLWVLGATCVSAQERANAVPSRTAKPVQEDPEANRLPVKRVVLYKNGVGYFEHVGTVKDNQSVGITFTTGQLDDVLKSLTVLDQGGGRITGVTYGSSAPLDRQLADLRLNTGEKTTLTEFLGALRGARIEIRTGTATITGRLLSVERKTRTGGGSTVEVDYLSLITDSGEVKTTELATGFSVRLLDAGLSSTVKRYLDLVGLAREPDQRRMTIVTAGTGTRPLLVSYISETPVWKATYRIVLPSKQNQKPLLQGWAIVDNTGAQDWENVELSLVAGAPQSFVQKLSTPYYSRRPVVPIKESLSAAPQTFEAPVFVGSGRLTGTVRDASGSVVAGARVKAFEAAGSVVGEAISDGQGRFAVSTVPDGQLRLEVESPGFRKTVQYVMATAGQPLNLDMVLQVGATAESVEVSANASAVATESTSLAVGRAGSGRALGSSAALGRGTGTGGGIGSGRGGGFASGSGGGMGGGVFTVATPEDLGDLFEYKLREPISIRKSQSALVPILQTEVSAEKVSIWNERNRLAKPLRALWLDNSSGSTLDGGSISVLESGVFAGEGIFESIRQGEKRLISYATDLALTPDTKASALVQRVTRVRVSGGVLAIVKEQAESKSYTFRNADAVARAVIVEHPARLGYELRSQNKPVETSAGSMRFRLEVPPQQTASLIVEEARPIEATYQISNLNSDQVALFVRERSIDKTIEAALSKVLAQKAVVASLDSEKDAHDEESKKIYDDQQRLRENMKALKGSQEERALLQRYTKQLNDQENRLEQLNKEAEDLVLKQQAAQAELDRIIQSLVFDIKV